MKMKSAICLGVVFLATLLPVSPQQSGKPHAWMPQGRFGKRTFQPSEETALYSSKSLSAINLSITGSIQKSHDNRHV